MGVPRTLAVMNSGRSQAVHESHDNLFVDVEGSCGRLPIEVVEELISSSKIVTRV